ncbi:hypothetical protein [Vulcanisaeta souniana]|uniref:hypothetical protein n=1 Tax=Vulcanisaeta souniana TaxID=164452 RepID=UPI001FB2353D|nr:hypothetical protein [Vulcanisaeta souniana]
MGLLYVNAGLFLMTGLFSHGDKGCSLIVDGILMFNAGICCGSQLLRGLVVRMVCMDMSEALIVGFYCLWVVFPSLSLRVSFLSACSSISTHVRKQSVTVLPVHFCFSSLPMFINPGAS